VYGIVGRSLEYEPDTVALVARVAEQVKPPGHKVIECNPQVLTGC
jgi:hypothetical protein